MSAILSLIYREFCLARVAEMRRSQFRELMARLTRGGVTQMPISTFKAAVLLAVVVMLAGAGTWVVLA